MIKRYYQVNRKDIAIIQFIIEGYEGMATVTTVDPKTACLRIAIIEDQLDDFELLVEDLKKTMPILEVAHPRVYNFTRICIIDTWFDFTGIKFIGG